MKEQDSLSTSSRSRSRNSTTPDPSVNLDEIPDSFQFDPSVTPVSSMISDAINKLHNLNLTPLSDRLTSSTLPLKLNFLSQNVMKLNILQHAILNNALSGLGKDIILLQEPWHGRIGLDYERQSTESRSEKLGTVNNREWIQILPTTEDIPDVVAYVRKKHHGWNITLRADLIRHPSIMILHVSTGTEDLLIVNLYNPSDNSVAPLLSAINFPDIPTIITGDFNLHHPMWKRKETKADPIAQPLVNWLTTYQYTLLNNTGEITWQRGKLSSVLDLTWANQDAFPLIQHWGVREDLHTGSDHLPITWTYNTNTNESHRKIPEYKTQEDLQTPWAEAFSNKLREGWIWNDVLSDEPSFLMATNVLHDAMIYASELTLKPKPKKPRPSFWFTNSCRKELNELRLLKRKTKINKDYLTLRKAERHFKKTVTMSKRLGSAEFAAKVTHKNVWRLNSWYRGRRNHFTPVLKDSEGKPHISPEEKTNLMHSAWFDPPKPIEGNFEWSGTDTNTREFASVTWKEIHETLTSTSNTSAPGGSGIGYRILKWALSECPDEITAIIRASIKLGIHLPRWKTALIVVIPKAKKPTYSDPKAWRPIQLLDTLGKLVEKIMAKRIIYDIGKYNLTPLEQFGGRSNSSCYDAVISLTHDIQMGKKANKVSSLLAMDVKGFFDHIHHNRLTKVLWDMGFPPNVCSWVGSFVSQRSAAIRLDDFVSEAQDIHIGVPQGSPVSPMFVRYPRRGCLIDTQHINCYHQGRPKSYRPMANNQRGSVYSYRSKDHRRARRYDTNRDDTRDEHTKDLATSRAAGHKDLTITSVT